ncbi:MAG: M36 family metallopeptidase [Chitinophagaceae bacterium]|nr:M36 family metallopeptidase [Chitinophagaceae bacterium]
MKRVLLLIFSFAFACVLQAQQNDQALAMQLVSKNAEAIGINKEDLSNIKLSSTYYNSTSGSQMVYLLQSYKGLPVFNQMLVLAFKDGKPVSNAGRLLTGMDKLTNNQSPVPAMQARDAVKWAFLEAGLPQPSSLTTYGIAENGRIVDFGKLNSTREKVIAELMWVPVEEGRQTSVKLAWQVQVAPNANADHWNIRVDAVSGKIINKNNYTVYEEMNSNMRMPYTATNQKMPRVNNVDRRSIVGIDYNRPQTNPSSPSLVNTVNYTVIPYPAESPIHPGGTAAVRTNPWTLAGGNAVSLGWHNDGALDYITSRGNNVHAHEDQANNNSNNGLMATSTTSPDPLNFNFTPNYTVVPTNPTFQQFALTNLFYWNNINHDITYKYGFDEPAGNFQQSNQGRGGLGNDYVNADGQDGGGTNNANMSTPPDGSKPRMQMYLWSAPTLFTVNSPVVIAGNYFAREGAMSTANLLTNVGPKTGQLVWYNDDAAGTTHYACNPPNNVITGKVALIVRGFGGATCTATVPFTTKVKNAQNAGAIAVVIVNNAPGLPPLMGGTDNTITIPAIAISDVDGATIAAQIANNVNITMSAGVAIDGDIDNGIISHEYFHGVSNRLTGGPATTSCLGNAEQGGEGWSDYQALMVTTDWAAALPTDGVNKPKPMGNYAFGLPITGPGIRLYPYCTNIAVNPLTYADMGTGTVGTEVHNIGEIWCMALWEMTWGLIQTDGINSNLFNNAGAGGNSVAFKLMMEGMKLQPCNPGYIDARNAILQADINLYGGIHYCTIYTAFAKRGMGYSASQGSAFSATDQTAATDLPPGPTISGHPANVSVCAGANTTFTVTSSGPNRTFQWQVSTNGGGSWTNITNGGVYSGALTATLTLTGVTLAMNAYQYRCIVNGGCIPPTTVNSNAAILTVSSGAPVINTQPSNASICSGNNTSFTITATATPISYQWQESTNGGGTWNNVTNGGIYGGATTATLTLTGVLIGMNSYQYRCAVTGGCGGTTVNTNAAVLTVTSGATINNQPANSSICTGANTTFGVTATGSSLGYQWQESTNGGGSWNNISNGGIYSGATTNTLSLTGVTAGMNGYQYRCVVSNTCSPLNSNAAILTVNTAPNISAQPANSTTCSGNAATFSVTASGGGLTYQWQESTNGGGTWNNLANGAPYSGVLTSTLTINPTIVGMNNYQYHCIVTGSCNPAATSNGGILTVGAALTITSQPANSTVCAGANTSFGVVISGTVTSYQWQESTNGGGTWNNITNGGIYGGATTATLSLTGVLGSMNNYQYRCFITGSCPGINSNPATLTVNTAPNITSQPNNNAICETQGTTFSTVVSGTGLSYQWQLSTTGCGGAFSNLANGGVYSGATTSTLTITGATTAMTGYAYKCVITGTCTPVATSNCATLTVNTAVNITSQPAASTLCAGLNTSFSVTATGSSITYQWQESTNGGGTWNNVTNGGIYSGATTATLTLTGVLGSMNSYQYRCVVSGAAGCSAANSNAAILTVNTAPNITAQPTASTICATSNTSFSLTANGTAISYQWQLSTTGCAGTFSNIANGGVYAGATTASLTITGAPATMNGYAYRCVINGTCAPAATSSCVTLTVNTAVTISNQPANSTVCAGSNTSFAVTAAGTTPAYQWQESTNGGSTWNNVVNGGVYGGATTATLALTGVTAGMNGNLYRCAVNGAAPCGSVNSSNAVLTVNTGPTISTQPVSGTTICSGQNTSYGVVANGTGLTYQWQVSTDGGANYSNLANGGFYSGVTTATLSITGATVGMSSYRYRCIVTGTCSPTVTSTSALLTVNTPVSVTTAPANATICATGTTSFSIVAAGSSPTYQWQESTNGGTTWNNVVNGGVYSGATTNTLTLTGVVVGMNGYLYRNVVSGLAPCAPVNSAAATLTVSPRPVVTLSAAPYTRLRPGIPSSGTMVNTTITASVVPNAGPITWSWTLNGNAIGATGNTVNVNLNTLGLYTAVATLGSCTSAPASILIGDSASDILFIYPSPNTGRFTVSYYVPGASSTNSSFQNITIYDSEGRRVFNNSFTVAQPYQLHPIDLSRNGAGVYYVVLREANGHAVRTGEVLVR